jgi:hypothetical protein
MKTISSLLALITSFFLVFLPYALLYAIIYMVSGMNLNQISDWCNAQASWLQGTIGIALSFSSLALIYYVMGTKMVDISQYFLKKIVKRAVR